MSQLDDPKQSLVMIRTRKVVIIGGCFLAFGAAYTNTGMMLQVGTSVSHLTGDLSRLTISIARWSPAVLPEMSRVGIAALCFFMGATIAGLLIHHPVLNISRPYGRTIIGIGAAFLVSSLGLSNQPLAAIGLASLGCGLQNALSSHYRGMILRTTHMTGLFTDLGVTLGMRLRGYQIPLWKIMVPAMLIGSFMVGGLAGAASDNYGYNTTLIAGISYCMVGIGWTVIKHGLLKGYLHEENEFG
jgi:uncharacterized membrane protein YoaK (UPF0700 family)